MRVTRTIYVDLSKLVARGDEANLIIRLMRAADDIAMANRGLGEFSKPQPRLQQHAQDGARRYFVRLQCGHLSEALKLIDQLRKTPSLAPLLGGCTPDSRAAFDRLCECLRGGSRNRDFNVYIKGIRDKVAFHYDADLVRRALADRASRLDSRTSTITSGSDITLWRSGLADDIEDSIVCRQIWQIPRAADVRQEANRIADFGSNLCNDFLAFAGELAFRYVIQTAAK